MCLCVVVFSWTDEMILYVDVSVRLSSDRCQHVVLHMDHQQSQRGRLYVFALVVVVVAAAAASDGKSQDTVSSQDSIFTVLVLV